MTEIVLAALAGLIIGSFLNVCIFRLPRDLSVVRPSRSFCPSCEKTIAWYDNIPLLSYVLLRGRCRHCSERISARYPIVEGLTAAAFAGAVAMLGPTPQALKLCLFSAIMIALVITDFETLILPDELTLGGLALGLLLAWFIPIRHGLAQLFVRDVRAASLVEAIAAAGISAGALALLRFVYEKVRHREGMGLGDVKLVAMIGAFFGVQGVLMTLMAGSILGAVIGVAFVLIARKDAATYELPYGSFIGIAAIAVAFLGNPLFGWYGRLGG